jgi:digeranylgeranylglycerophospholipid reductase
MWHLQKTMPSWGDRGGQNMMKEKCDVVVIGGGPGGTSTAKTLADNNIDVMVFEKRPSIGSEKRCAEGVSLDTMNIIEKKIGKIPNNCISQIIKGAIVYAPNGKEIDIDFKESTGAILERKVYDKWLAIMASRSGAYVQTMTNVADVIQDNTYVNGVKGIFQGEKFEVRCNVVVAADGVESTIARKAGLDTTQKLANIESGFQYEMSNIKLRDPSKLELFFGNNIAPRGYLWIFPKGKDIANVGIGIGNSKLSAKYYVDKFIQEHQHIFSKASIIEVNSGGIPVGGLLDNMVLNGFLAVGDAAHQVNPIHGGGLKEATMAGSIAGEIITRAIKNGDYSQKNLSEYNKIWWKERGNTLKRVEKIKVVVEKLSDKDLNKLADALSGDDLVEFSRGNRLIKLAKILLKNPSLIPIAKKLF